MDFSFDPEITKEVLLEYNNEETYMAHYLNMPIKKGLFKSPLREDHHPTCSFFKGKRLYYKDFATGECLTFENVVMKRYCCNYQEALKIIAKDFGIIKDPNHKVAVIPKQETFKKEKNTIIQIEAKSFTKEELKWWESFGITKETLNKYRVFSCQTVFLMVILNLYMIQNVQAMAIILVKIRIESYGRYIIHLERHFAL